MRVYLDNCCYNRPYDDQTQIRIYLETEAMSMNESYYVGEERDEEAKEIAKGIIETGVKNMDALHVACYQKIGGG